MSMLGTRVVRKEDPDLLTAGGRYVDDTPVAGALHAVFVRSQFAHGEITTIDADEAASMPGVVAVYTAADLGLEPTPPSMPMFNPAMTRTRLAAGRVRYVGEPVAVVVAESYVQAVDAAELVFADVDPLPAVVSVHDALADETLLHPDAGTNTVFAMPGSGADVLAGCEVTVELSFRNHRLAPCPLEPRAAVATWDVVDGVERLTQWSCNQGAHAARDGLAAALGLDPEHVRVITPDVGGGFGAKNGTYPEDIVVAMAARRLGRPVRWAETRSESMLGLHHGRGQEITAAIGGSRDGPHHRPPQPRDPGRRGIPRGWIGVATLRPQPRDRAVRHRQRRRLVRNGRHQHRARWRIPRRWTPRGSAHRRPDGRRLRPRDRHGPRRGPTHQLRAT